MKIGIAPIHMKGNQNKKKRVGKETRVKVWNTRDGVKMCGNAAPLSHNVEAYLRRNPHMELYDGQDADDTLEENWRLETETAQRVRLSNGRVLMQNRETGHLMGGNACPLYRNMKSFLANSPMFERTESTAQRKEKKMTRSNKKFRSASRTEDEVERTVFGDRCDGAEKDEVEDTATTLFYFSEASMMEYGPGKHDNLFEIPLSAEDGKVQQSDSFDESFLR